MPTILTINGPMDADTLDKRTIFEERAAEFVIAVEYRLRDESAELVRRDCHVIQKDPSVTATAVVGGF